MLEVRNLHAYYGKSHILQGVDLDIAAGEVVSLLGRNGVGRSTTVKAIMGEVPPQGTIRFKGQDIAGLPSHKIARLGLGYVPEHRDIFPSLTVRQNLILGIKDPRRPGKWRLQEMLDMFPNLARRADTPAGVLSGGEKQMLALASVLVIQPDTIIADEPTTLLDLRNRRRIVRELLALQQQLIVVTHDLDMLRDFERVLVIDEGRLAYDGAPSEAISFYTDLMDAKP